MKLEKQTLKTGDRWRIRFRDRYGVRRRINAFTDQQESHKLGVRIDELVAACITGGPLSLELRTWIEQLPATLRDRLADLGLVDLSTLMSIQPLDGSVVEYADALDAKERTSAHVELIQGRLLKLFHGCGCVQWRDINAEAIERWLKGRRKAGKMSQQTSNHYVRAIKAFCTWAVKTGRAATSPVVALEMLTITDSDDRGAFTVEQIQTLLAYTRTAPRIGELNGPDRYMLYRMALETGLRLGEVGKLTRADFALDEPTVTIQAKHAKNRKRATVPLRKVWAAELRTHLDGKLPTAAAFRVPPRGHGAKLIRADMQAAGVTSVDEMGLRLDFHSLRHTAGSWLVARGVPLKIVSQILRHSTIKITADRYSHIQREALVEALEDNMPDLDAAQATGTEDHIRTKHSPQMAAHGRDCPRYATSRYDARRTGGGAVERAGLENRYALRGIVGSNPTLSVVESKVSRWPSRSR